MSPNPVLLGFKPSLYWPLDDPVGSSVVRDLSSNAYDGTPGSGVTLGEAGYRVGELAVLFDNTSNAYITSSYSPFVVGSQRTFMGWANLTDGANYRGIFGDVGHTVQCYVTTGSSSITFKSLGSAGAVAWASAIPGYGQWFHLALTYDDSTQVAELYSNGVSLGTRTLPSPYSGSANGLQLGEAASTYWNGDMQDVAVFERILDSEDILQIYNSFFGPLARRRRMERIGL